MFGAGEIRVLEQGKMESYANRRQPGAGIHLLMEHLWAHVPGVHLELLPPLCFPDAGSCSWSNMVKFLGLHGLTLWEGGSPVYWGHVRNT